MIFGQTVKPYCLEMLQKERCLPKVLIENVQSIEVTQALEMTDAQAAKLFKNITNP